MCHNWGAHQLLLHPSHGDITNHQGMEVLGEGITSKASSASPFYGREWQWNQVPRISNLSQESMRKQWTSALNGPQEWWREHFMVNREVLGRAIQTPLSIPSRRMSKGLCLKIQVYYDLSRWGQQVRRALPLKSQLVTAPKRRDCGMLLGVPQRDCRVKQETEGARGRCGRCRASRFRTG